MQIDLNADLGEGAASDRELMQLITSANVCCGEHAGGPAEIAETLELARMHGVAIGGHPGHPDRANFGRVERDYPRETLIAIVKGQLAVLEEMARARGLRMAYVKPHGALYNQACRERGVADAVVDAVSAYCVPLVGLPGSQLEIACRDRISFVPEGFADRRYRPDGLLVPRNEPDAFVHDSKEAVEQVEHLLRERKVRTVCVHGDNPEAVAFAGAVKKALEERGIELKRFV